MSALNKKLYRDLWRMKGQAIAIGMVLATGITMFVMSFSTHDSLQRTRDRYYAAYRFADVFASCKRAPEYLAETLAEIPGVAQVQTRIVANVTLDIAGFSDIATGQFVSLRYPQERELNQQYLREGRLPVQDQDNEILGGEAFMAAHGFEAGQSLSAIINGKKRDLLLVGTALSPEFIYSVKSGATFPDNLRFGVFWMNHQALAAAMGMDGAFNHVTLRLHENAVLEDVLDRVDLILEPFGGLKAIPRKDQVSHWFITNELEQLKTMGLFVPMIFLLVAIFLLNLVISRMIQAQRQQIAILKAFGFSNHDIGWHYLKMVLLIVIFGNVLGTFFGAWMGRNLTGLYTVFYSFPFLDYFLSPKVILQALALGLIAAVAGTFTAVRKAVILPPAEAMKPEPPDQFRPTLIERLGWGRYLSPQTRMVFRHLERHGLRTGLAVLGMALSVAVLVLGRFNGDAIERMMFVQFRETERQDLMVTFVEPRSQRAFFELKRLEGVQYAEPLRAVPVRITAGHLERQTSIIGLTQVPDLMRPLDKNLRPIRLPQEGLLIGKKLAEVIRVGVGDWLQVEVLDGKRATMELMVTGLVDEFLGSNVYMNLPSLNRVMKEGKTVNGAYLRVDAFSLGEICNTLKFMPDVVSVTIKEATIVSFQETMAENLLIFNLFNIIFSSIIAFGVVYNSAQMSLAERGRDLATLRVLGFTRAEISGILLGELVVVVLMAIPLGFVLGYGMSAAVAKGMETELFRIPLYLRRETFGIAAMTIIASATISGMVVRRKLDRLDLLAVLKTRE